MKLVEQFLRSRVGVEIDVGVRMSVAREKLAQTQRLRRVPRSQQNHVAKAAADQRDPAQNERAHEDFAKFGVPGDQRSQIVVAHFQKFAAFRDPAAHQTKAAGNHRHLSRETVRPHASR